jgi:hypothetical protein
MVRTTLALGAFAVALAAASPAAAQDGTHGFGAQGSFILSGERLISLFSYGNLSLDNAGGNGSTSNSRTSFSLLSSGGGVVGPTPYNIPRLALDYAVIPNLTVGGSVWLYGDLSASGSNTTGAQTITSTQSKVTYWGFAPRAGYVLSLTDMFAFWPRGGFEYHHIDVGGGDTTIWQLAASIEAMFAFVPVEHFAITLGPAADIPITGKTGVSVPAGPAGGATTTASVSSSFFQLGLVGGLLGYF